MDEINKKLRITCYIGVGIILFCALIGSVYY